MTVKIVVEIDGLVAAAPDELADRANAAADEFGVSDIDAGASVAVSREEAAGSASGDVDDLNLEDDIDAGAAAAELAAHAGREEGEK